MSSLQRPCGKMKTCKVETTKLTWNSFSDLFGLTSFYKQAMEQQKQRLEASSLPSPKTATDEHREAIDSAVGDKRGRIEEESEDKVPEDHLDKKVKSQEQSATK